MNRFPLFFISLFAGVWLNSALAFDPPSLIGPVMDQAGVLNSGEAAEISQRLHGYRQQSGEQIQVLILPSLNDEPIETVAIQTFDKWKLGDKKKDDGVLFVIAMKDRKMRIEVGQGLEGSIPDLVAKRIISEITRPMFKSGNYQLGILLTVEAIHQAAVEGASGKIFSVEDFKKQIIAQSQQSQSGLNEKQRRSLDQPSKGESSGNNLSGGIIIAIVLGLWFLLFLFSPSTALWILYALMSGGRGGGGSGGGGGGWSGGGGSSSGGGASGDW